MLALYINHKSTLCRREKIVIEEQVRIWEKKFWYLSFARFLGVNKDESKNELTVLKLKLNQEIKEAIPLAKGVLFSLGRCPIARWILATRYPHTRRVTAGRR